MTEFSGTFKEAIDKLELFVAIDFSMSPTCDYADVALPAPTFWEKHDLVGTGCHPYLQLQQPVVSPQYDRKSEFWMVRELLRRIDPEKARYFDMTELEAIEQLLKTGGKETEGITLEKLQQGPVRLNVHCSFGCDCHDPGHRNSHPKGTTFLRTHKMRESHRLSLIFRYGVAASPLRGET